MDPFAAIVRIDWTPSGIYAFDKDGGLVAQLDVDGVAELRALYPGIKVETHHMGGKFGVVETHRKARKFDVLAATTDIVFLAKDASPRLVDGVPAWADATILVNHQRNPAQNGIYRVFSMHYTDGGHWVLAGEQPELGDQIRVREGHTQAGTVWVWKGDHAVPFVP